ncbi:uncharacterized protein OGAPODRAFT_17352 [Ogataea polymorpha]|uniref:uncharacterized protein n=1 Tax=Ogataea polymorpha TaxID=460523 RepID=UPI0007F4485C|nr:uncharacterized protein OGAPODRAFT_17352 [Ogataea polymorpha]OBA13551.1 hypothetical protein OGAPODRAFT_17352 [Ogataea polymorpha]
MLHFFSSQVLQSEQLQSSLQAHRPHEHTDSGFFSWQCEHEHPASQTQPLEDEHEQGIFNEN